MAAHERREYRSDWKGGRVCAVLGGDSLDHLIGELVITSAAKCVQLMTLALHPTAGSGWDPAQCLTPILHLALAQTPCSAWWQGRFEGLSFQTITVHSQGLDLLCTAGDGAAC